MFNHRNTKEGIIAKYTEYEEKTNFSRLKCKQIGFKTDILQKYQSTYFIRKEFHFIF